MEMDSQRSNNMGTEIGMDSQTSINSVLLSNEGTEMEMSNQTSTSNNLLNNEGTDIEMNSQTSINIELLSNKGTEMEMSNQASTSNNRLNNEGTEIETSIKSELLSDERTKMNNLPSTSSALSRNYTTSKYCPSCTWKETVKLSDIERGDHICYRSSCCTPYRHHAIVEKVENNILYLINLQRPNDECILRCFCKKLFKVMDTQEDYGNMKRLKVVRYPSSAKLPSDNIIQNAKYRMNQFKNENETYNLCTYNCEHFCYECTIGSRSSIQIQSRFRKCGICLQCVFSPPSLALKYIMILSIIHISHKITHKYNAHTIEQILFCLVCAIPLLVCIIMQFYYCKQKENTSCFPDYCSGCSKRHSVIRWIRLVVFFVFQMIWFLYVHGFLFPKNLGIPNLDSIQYPLDIVISLAYSFITLFFISIIPRVVCCYPKMKK